jgi:hypothetical protein
MADKPDAPAGAMPRVGDRLWYILYPYGEYVPAVVVDHIPTRTPTGAIEQVPAPELESDDCLHLEFAIPRPAYTAAAARGYALNVREGDAIGNWAREKPKDADARVARAREREAILREERRRMMRETL